jgi:hypothetical protein
MRYTVGVFMKKSRLFWVGLVLVLGSQVMSAQDAMGYRAYALNTSLDTVLATSGGRAADARVLHERPAMIQELEWRAPYANAAGERVDPVRQITFLFCDDALYQVVVSYDPDRTDGLSNGEIIDALTTAYGSPMPGSARNRPLDAPLDTVVLAQWDRAGASLTLLRRVYSAEFQLLLTSKVLATRARSAIREAERLNIVDAPRREREQRTKDAVEATAARDKIRAANKAAFRP